MHKNYGAATTVAPGNRKRHNHPLGLGFERPRGGCCSFLRHFCAEWRDADIDEADEVALQIIEDVLAERFEPNPDFRSPWDDWARICGTGIMSVDEEIAHGDQA